MQVFWNQLLLLIQCKCLPDRIVCHYCTLSYPTRITWLFSSLALAKQGIQNKVQSTKGKFSSSIVGIMYHQSLWQCTHLTSGLRLILCSKPITSSLKNFVLNLTFSLRNKLWHYPGLTNRDCMASPNLLKPFSWPCVIDSVLTYHNMVK